MGLSTCQHQQQVRVGIFISNILNASFLKAGFLNSSRLPFHNKTKFGSDSQPDWQQRGFSYNDPIGCLGPAQIWVMEVGFR